MTQPLNSPPISMFDVIAYVETKNNPHALRFEPVVYDRISKTPMVANANQTIDKIRSFNKCSWGTAHVIYASSYGAVQIMGFNLYDLDFAGDIVEFCGDPIAQASMFAHFCQVKNLSHSVDDIASLPILRHDFARIYNGDGTAYAAQIVYALEHFNIKVVQ